MFLHAFNMRPFLEFSFASHSGAASMLGRWIDPEVDTCSQKVNAMRFKVYIAARFGDTLNET